MAEFRAPHQDVPEFPGHQHLQDQLQRVHRDAERTAILSLDSSSDARASGLWVFYRASAAAPVDASRWRARPPFAAGLKSDAPIPVAVAARRGRPYSWASRRSDDRTGTWFSGRRP